jgi:hypothetical protein
MTSTIITTSYILAAILDGLAVLAAKCLPIDGAGVTYTPRTPWRVDLWKEQGNQLGGGSWVLQVGGWELAMDRR